MKSSFLFLIFILFSISGSAQLTPEVTSWIINTTGDTGYNGIPSNVQLVQYSDNNVYVSSTCIPGYDIGPWNGNPNTPANQNFVFKITRHPMEKTGTPTNVGLGHIGVWTNGVSIFNPKDGMSYNNQGVWNRNALYYEGVSFDDCLGHPAPNGEYHHHVNPVCLYDDTDSLNHSPIIGFAFDGFPVYGAYGYTNTDGTGPIKRMRSSYALTTNTTRSNGPGVNATYPAGCFVEDYTYIVGAGDLDEHNGRYCITPDYPDGIYAYFVTIDASLYPVYPFVLGPTYYGAVQTGNTGPGSGHNTITESVTTYTTTGVNDISKKIHFDIFPNPASDYVTLFVERDEPNNLEIKMTDELGQVMMKEDFIQPSVPYTFDLTSVPDGIYFVTLRYQDAVSVLKLIVKR
jgi:hypothetical protein